MIDRTLEIQARASRPMTPQVEPEDREDPREFFSLASECQQMLSIISLALGRLSKLRHSLYTATLAHENAQQMRECESQRAEINAQIDEARSAIGSLSCDLETSSLTESKMRSNMYSTLLRRLQTIIRDYHSINSDILATQREKAVRLLKISSDGLSEEEARALIERGVTAADSMKAQLSLNEEESTLRRRLFVVTDKVQDLKKLEESIRKLNTIFVEMSQLVFEQGKAIDSIEFSVINSKKKINTAKVVLIEAKKKQRTHMKLAICLCIVILVVIAVIVVPLIVPLL